MISGGGVSLRGPYRRTVKKSICQMAMAKGLKLVDSTFCFARFKLRRAKNGSIPSVELYSHSNNSKDNVKSLNG